MDIYNNDITSATIENYIWHPIPKNSTIFNAEALLACAKILFLIYDFHLCFHVQSYNSLPLLRPLSSTLPHANLLILINIYPIPWILPKS